VSGRTFADLVDEGAAVPVEGWDFSWFAGRATEQRPAWGYAGLLAVTLGRAAASLDVQTGGGEVYAAALSRAARRPHLVAATESWPANLAVSRRTLSPWEAQVVEAAEDGALPFPDATFDLVSSRHPTDRRWDEIARVLRPGGTYLSQGVGTGSNRELYEFLMGPQPEPAVPAAQRAVRDASAAGLEVVDLREQATRVEFFDVAAVVHFLRKVVWTVPGFTVKRYRDRLADLHDVIEREGSFVCHSQRYLVETRRPG
jgi:SAM-dependent methyltransferase